MKNITILLFIIALNHIGLCQPRTKPRGQTEQKSKFTISQQPAANSTNNMNVIDKSRQNTVFIDTPTE